LAVQATQLPALLQTMFVPQDVPVAFWVVLLLQTIVPVLQLVTPVKHGFGLPVQLWFGVHAPQVPMPSQTWLVPQLVPAVLLPVPSTQVVPPVRHDVVPILHALGLPVHVLPAVQATQTPLPLQTMLVPQPVPAALLLPSMHVMPPVRHDVVPFRQLVGLPVQVLPAVQPTQMPLPLQT
jgi:hypothetical protein